ncbi:MAG: hypothetical protein E7C95_00360 [Anaerococcus prevotii]|uniref:hypothetical protein n=1 Tax=Anaerococcus prevotii TaxID=33034 RepID=UPI0029007EB7|nr:hypothetical protein [Anaerococcus prevotii]MDU2557404.1 hypothetical protein [Anaerococcus prevotii]
MRYAASNKEISCIIGNLFENIKCPCSLCDDNSLIITGETYGQRKATILIKDSGIFDLIGDEGIEEEVAAIRDGRCPY